MTPENHQQLLERIASSLERIERLLASKSTNSLILESVDEIKTALPASSSIPATLVSNTDAIETFLNKKGIKIKRRKAEDPADKIFDKLSVFLGNNYSSLSNILAQIKRSMQTGDIFHESLSKLSKDDIGNVCQFCQSLKSLALLEQYRYFPSEKKIIAKATTLPKAQNLFSGQWLERYTLKMLREAYGSVQSEAKIGKFHYLINPQITLPNEDDFELDIIALIGDLPFWIEAKSGEYSAHVKKYSQFARQLGLDQAHSMLVLTDIDPRTCADLSSIHPIKVLPLNMLKSEIIATIKKDHQLEIGA